ncbi:hypothetical protein SASPL_124275 [Salvia splendens]|uniref:Disease resistance R13L4/SHOC-2-like LRR domain-containing protein n=1 Tax=Salvia splendens TaxID=180675 RepID=A0A8X8ZUT7_SALSN|nr:hypothetical protein SASPL_124275 [Salvia splendens]
MAYAALVSLTNTINQTLNSNLYSISLEENQQITPLLEYVTPFQDFLDNFPDKFNSLEGRMRDLANAAEDILEYLALENVYPTPDEDHPSEKHELAQLQNVIKEIDLIDKEVNEIEDTSRYKSIQRGAHSSSSTSTAPLIHKDDMVCLEEYVLDLKDRICGEPSKKLCDGSTIHSIKCSTYRLVNLECLKRVRLLRVFDAEVVDVECSPFPAQLYELFHLRYLDIRFVHGIPTTLSKLQNLQTLIIREQTKHGFAKAYDIWLSWGMPQLRHVYFYGTIHFHDPNEVACSLESLQTLSYVSHWSCRERVLKMIPNLNKLKIDCSGRVHSGAPACLDDLGHLHKLENLEIYAGHCVRSRPKYYRFTFPSMLKKLTLKALKFPWNDIVVVGSLPNLQVLKLKGCTCDGGTWETREGAFPDLEVLLVEDSRFEHLITESIHFPRLKRLLLYSCSFLNEIPNDIGEIPPLELIEIKGYAKKSLVESAELIREEQKDMGNYTLQVICIALKSSSSGSFYSDEGFILRMRAMMIKIHDKDDLPSSRFRFK